MRFKIGDEVIVISRTAPFSGQRGTILKMLPGEEHVIGFGLPFGYWWTYAERELQHVSPLLLLAEQSEE